MNDPSPLELLEFTLQCENCPYGLGFIFRPHRDRCPECGEDMSVFTWTASGWIPAKEIEA